MSIKVGIIGAGISGCTSAYMLNRKGYDVKIFERGEHLGGGVWTHQYAGHPYTFGPRMFFTDNQRAISFMNQFAPMKEITNYTLTFSEADSDFFNYPIYRPDLERLKDKDQIKKELANLPEKASIENFEKYWLSTIGETLYNKFVNNYSKKMWQIKDNNELTANWNWINRGSPIRETDKRLYKDMYTGYPIALNGYNDYFTKMTEGCEVNFNITVKDVNKEKNGKLSLEYYETEKDCKKVAGYTMLSNNPIAFDFIEPKIDEFDLVVNTTALDYLFNNKFVYNFKVEPFPIPYYDYDSESLRRTKIDFKVTLSSNKYVLENSKTILLEIKPKCFFNQMKFKSIGVSEYCLENDWEFYLVNEYFVNCVGRFNKFINDIYENKYVGDWIKMVDYGEKYAV